MLWNLNFNGGLADLHGVKFAIKYDVADLHAATT